MEVILCAFLLGIIDMGVTLYAFLFGIIDTRHLYEFLQRIIGASYLTAAPLCN